MSQKKPEDPTQQTTEDDSLDLSLDEEQDTEIAVDVATEEKLLEETGDKEGRRGKTVPEVEIAGPTPVVPKASLRTDMVDTPVLHILGKPLPEVPLRAGCSVTAPDSEPEGEDSEVSEAASAAEAGSGTTAPGAMQPESFRKRIYIVFDEMGMDKEALRRLQQDRVVVAGALPPLNHQAQVSFHRFEFWTALMTMKTMLVSLVLSLAQHWEIFPTRGQVTESRTGRSLIEYPIRRCTPANFKRLVREFIELKWICPMVGCMHIPFYSGKDKKRPEVQLQPDVAATRHHQNRALLDFEQHWMTTHVDRTAAQVLCSETGDDQYTTCAPTTAFVTLKQATDHWMTHPVHQAAVPDEPGEDEMDVDGQEQAEMNHAEEVRYRQRRFREIQSSKWGIALPVDVITYPNGYGEYTSLEILNSAPDVVYRQPTQLHMHGHQCSQPWTKDAAGVPQMESIFRDIFKPEASLLSSDTIPAEAITAEGTVEELKAGWRNYCSQHREGILKTEEDLQTFPPTSKKAKSKIRKAKAKTHKDEKEEANHSDSQDPESSEPSPKKPRRESPRNPKVKEERRTPSKSPVGQPTKTGRSRRRARNQARLGKTRDAGSSLILEKGAESIRRLPHEQGSKISGHALNLARVQRYHDAAKQVDDCMKTPVMKSLAKKIRLSRKGDIVIPTAQEDSALRNFYATRCRRTVALQQALHTSRCCKEAQPAVTEDASRREAHFSFEEIQKEVEKEFVTALGPNLIAGTGDDALDFRLHVVNSYRAAQREDRHHRKAEREAQEKKDQDEGRKDAKKQSGGASRSSSSRGHIRQKEEVMDTSSRSDIGGSRAGSEPAQSKPKSPKKKGGKPKPTATVTSSSAYPDPAPQDHAEPLPDVRQKSQHNRVEWTAPAAPARYLPVNHASGVTIDAATARGIQIMRGTVGSGTPVDDPDDAKFHLKAVCKDLLQAEKNRSQLSHPPSVDDGHVHSAQGVVRAAFDDLCTDPNQVLRHMDECRTERKKVAEYAMGLWWDAEHAYADLQGLPRPTDAFFQAIHPDLPPLSIRTQTTEQAQQILFKKHADHGAMLAREAEKFARELSKMQDRNADLEGEVESLKGQARSHATTAQALTSAREARNKLRENVDALNKQLRDQAVAHGEELKASVAACGVQVETLVSERMEKLEQRLTNNPVVAPYVPTPPQGTLPPNTTVMHPDTLRNGLWHLEQAFLLFTHPDLVRSAGSDAVLTDFMNRLAIVRHDPNVTTYQPQDLDVATFGPTADPAAATPSASLVKYMVKRYEQIDEQMAQAVGTGEGEVIGTVLEVAEGGAAQTPGMDTQPTPNIKVEVKTPASSSHPSPARPDVGNTPIPPDSVKKSGDYDLTSSDEN